MGISINVYAAYKAGFLGNNILDTYFSFVANILVEEDITVVEVKNVIELFNKKYNIELPETFVHQVLGVGIEKKALVSDHGKYTVSLPELEKYRFDIKDFDKQWDNLKNKFRDHCNKLDIKVSNENIDEIIIEYICKESSVIDYEEKVEESSVSSVDYGWYTFLKELYQDNTSLYNFIVALSASNSTGQALFYSGEDKPDYSDLNIYLDSPIIFALLGMDIKERTQSYKKLLCDIQKSGAKVHVLDRNFQEVDGLITKAAFWSQSAEYDIGKANNAARFFHDNSMTEDEIAEFCGSVESKLNELDVTVVNTSYKEDEHKFQEDSTEITEMIKNKYTEQGYSITKEKEESINTDATSIVMIYRMRQGQTATHLSKSKHLLLTSNNAVANIAKQYESNRSINSGHIPACISIDLFGTVLWLNSPLEMMEYKKLKMISDCYGFLRPTRSMLNKYIESLENARKADEIDEKKYLFLRAHPVVMDSLMNITRGDYARFDSQTYREVYDDIILKSQKPYLDEVESHEKTKSELNNSLAKIDRLQNEYNDVQMELDKMKEAERKRNENKRSRKIKFLGWISTLVFFGIPYIILISVVELLKAKVDGITINSVIIIVALCVLSAILALLFKKGKKFCFKKVSIIIDKKAKQE